MLFRTLTFCLAAIVSSLSIQAQNRTWSEMSAGDLMRSSGERRIAPNQARYVSLDMPALRSQLAQAQAGTIMDRRSSTTVISLPTPDGGVANFRVLEVSIMHPDLQAQFPQIRTYSGVGVDDVGTTVKLDVTEHGFHAMVMPLSREPWFIDPLFVGNTTNYQVYEKRHFVKTHATAFQGCGYDQVNDLDAAALQTRQWIDQMGVDRVGDCQLRTYRLALACTGEYAAFHGGTTSGAMSAMVTTMNRVNDMFERDATLTMVMVANNSSLIYLNASTDPYSNTNGSTMLGQNQTTCDNVIGSANYDIGHVFSTGGGGVAYLYSPCNNGSKAGGVTGQSNPVGDPFDIDYVAHEMGHQYGGNHTQNNNCNRASSASVEVGSGVTIMGYAGICAPNPVNNSIAMFGGYSMQEIAANVTSGTSSTCPTTSTIVGQTAPTVSAGVDRTIPKSTPFVLVASGSDAQTSQTLTYSWEQIDPAVATMPPVSTNTGGPAWIPKLPTTSPVRYMPNLTDVLANNSPTWEVLASVARTYNFRVTVRDNLDNGACNGQDNMVVTVSSTSGPFLVTQPNTAVSWAALTSRTITWNVASTTAAPVSCANVNILLSTDGGLTFPTTLAANTPNDGTQAITLPNTPSTTARIKVECASNIFYDLSNTNFTITASSSPDYTLSVTNATATVCQPNNATYAVQIGSILSYNSAVTLSASGLPAGANAAFSTNPVTPAGSSTLTISNTTGITPGSYPFTLNATSASGPKSIALTLIVNAAAGQVTLLTPSNGATDFSGPLTWNADPYAVTYTVTIASNASMTTVVETGTGITGTSYQPTTATAPNTTYYWNVRTENPCGTGTASATRSFTTANCQAVTVKITLDRYGEETTWSVVDDNSNIIVSGGPYSQAGSNGEYPQPDVDICLPAGCYDLIVNDSYGDGLCCSYGNGLITVVDANQTPLVAGVSTFTSTVTQNFCITTAQHVLLSAKAFLQGPFNSGTNLMSDALRIGSLIPLLEPYAALTGFTHVGGGGESTTNAVLASNTVPSNAIVDWVFLELRSGSNSSQVIATRSALIQRDGDIVDLDGVSPVSFPVAPANYYVAVRHRNHLGCMAASSIALTSTTAALDLTTSLTGTYGAEAQKSEGTVRLLWTGNAFADGALLYTGTNNDRDAILSKIGGVVPTNTVAGYFIEDVSMDGVVIYTGASNDRDLILENIGGVVPTNTRAEQLP